MTINELRKLGRQLGERTTIGVTSGVGPGNWWIAWASFPRGESVECVATNRDGAKRLLAVCLRALAKRGCVGARDVLMGASP